MLSDGSEFPCETVNVSPGGIAIRGAKPGNSDERVVVYIEDLGRIEGRIVRSGSGWFTVEIHAASKKRERLAETIAWLVKSNEGGFANRRTRPRIDAAHEPILEPESTGNDAQLPPPNARLNVMAETRAWH